MKNIEMTPKIKQEINLLADMMLMVIKVALIVNLKVGFMIVALQLHLDAKKHGIKL
jgi:hypothetical protein